MKPIVIRSEAAKRDLVEHFVWQGEEAGVETARRFLQAARRSFEDLAAMPNMGPVKVRQGKYAGVRMWRVAGFESVLIFYRPVSNGVSIERLVHARRDFLRVLT